MHVPDGFLDATTSVATYTAAAAGVGLALRGARRELDDRTAPLAGLVAVFIFAAQMLSFPVAAGTSGHLIGGALAAVLVGPWVATLCVTVVLVVQALAFADGGITALGTNVVLMSIVAVWVGWGVFVVVRRVLPARLSTVPVAAGVGAFVSVPATALTFAMLYAVGGQAPIDLTTLVGAMVGIHFFIGLGEAAITAVAVSSIIAVRPDIVVGARPLVAARELEIREVTRS